MKIPVERVELGPALGYDGYWIELPRSVKEGFLHELGKLGRGKGDPDDPESAVGRETNIKVVELISGWNLDDDAGKTLPLVSKCKTKAEKERVVAEIPVDILLLVARRISGSVQVPEATKDFSNG